jgi:hypothetical protein
MKKIVLLFILFTTLALAQSKDTCYTVQLLSKFNSQKNLQKLNEAEYPRNCKLMEIGNSLTVRCGCFDKYVDAQDSYEELKQNFKKATVATTYRYRFDDTVVEKSALKRANTITKEQTNVVVKEIAQDKTKKKLSKNKHKLVYGIRGKKDEELRLILQVYIYKGDVENAFKIASLGYEKYPNSYYWNEKMAQTSQWTGRTARAMKHLRYMYEVKYDPKIEQKLIKYGTKVYQYENIEPLVISRAKKFPTEKNIDLMIMVYKKIGSPDKVVKVLEDQFKENPTNYMFLSKALELSLEMGDMELSKRYVDIFEENKPYTIKDAELIARYYYIKRDIEHSYESLSYVKKDQKDTHDKEIKYYELKSDLGWYLQKNKEAAKASKMLMDLGHARLVDYERISFVYQKTDPKLAAKAVKTAYEKYKLSYLFYSYANSAINTKNYNELNQLINTIDKSDSLLLKEALYWMIKAKVYAHYEKYDDENYALMKAYELEPDNYQIKMELLWFFMQTHKTQELKMILLDLAQSDELDSASYLPIASAYFYLSDINRASYYTQELLYLNDPVTELLEFKFLQAYIYQIQANEGGFMTYMRDIYATLKKEAKKNPELKHDDKYLSSYLRSAMYILNPNSFEKKLEKSKEYLSKKNYDEISYSWAMRNHAYEKGLKIYHQMNKRDLWVKFNNAIITQNHTQIEHLLEFYLHSLSMGDASQVSHQDGQWGLSQTITFEGLRHNDANKNVYIRHLRLTEEVADRFTSKASYYDRSPLLQKFVKLTNLTYLDGGYFIDTHLNYFDNKTLDTNVLVLVPTATLDVGAKFKKLYDRGEISAGVAYHDSMDKYFQYGIDAKYRMSTDLMIKARLDKNMDSLESTQLLLAGKKDMAKVDLTWKFLDSTSIDFIQEANRYTSQDDVYVGKGYFSRVELNRFFRNGYPDIRLGMFYDRGVYDEAAGEKGVIEELKNLEFKVLPRNFYNIGFTFAYGLANLGPYTRVWRPYFQIYPYYNSDLDDYTYGLDIGYGGKIWHQDHLIFGASYTDSVNGTGGQVLELFLKYQFMYIHP